MGEIAAGVLVVAGAVTVGVAVGRWLPFAAFGIVAAVAVSLIQARFLDDTTWPWNLRHSHPLRFLGFLAETTPVVDGALEIRPTWWHLVYLVGLILFMCAVALVTRQHPASSRRRVDRSHRRCTRSPVGPKLDPRRRDR